MATLSQLEYIIMVDRLRHFGEAAKACHVSQPSLSAQIQKVEDELNIVLFDRNKKPIIPTQTGEKFIEQAKHVLREHRRLLQLAKNQEKEVAGTFRLGIIPTVSPYITHLFIQDFSTRFPKVDLTIEELTTDQIITQLRKDNLDGGILATPLHEEGLFERVLYYECFYLYVGPEHPLSKKNAVSEQDLSQSELWMLEEGHCLRTQVLKFCAPNRKTSVYANIHFHSGNLETLRNLVKKGTGYTVFPESFVLTLSKAERDAYVRPFKRPTPSREISIIHRRDQWKITIIEALEKTIKASLPKQLSPTDSYKKVMDLTT